MPKYLRIRCTLCNIMPKNFYELMDLYKRGKITGAEFVDIVDRESVDLTGSYYVDGMWFNHPKKEIYWMIKMKLSK